MGTWARAEAVGVVLAVWIIARLASRRPVAHPWFLAFAVAGAGAAAGDAATVLHGAARTAAHLAAAFAAFAAVVIFVEGLRRESGAPPERSARLALVLAACAVASVALARLPEPRAAILAGILVSVVLLNAVVPLAGAKRRRIGSWAIIAGIAVYALGRTAMVAAHLAAGDVRAVAHVADIASIFSFGAGLLTYALDGLREERRARAEVGHRPTTA